MEEKTQIIVSAVTDVVSASTDFITAFSAYGYVRKARKEKLKIEIEKTLITLENEAEGAIFESNLCGIQRAEKLLEEHQFSGIAKESAEAQFRIYLKRLENSLKQFENRNR